MIQGQPPARPGPGDVYVQASTGHQWVGLLGEWVPATAEPSEADAIVERVRRLVAARDGHGDTEATTVYENLLWEYWDVTDGLAWIIGTHPSEGGRGRSG